MRATGFERSLGNGVRGSGGRLAGSLSAFSVASEPGARDAPSRACLADDTSPMCTKASFSSADPPREPQFSDSCADELELLHG